jgi:NAD(P)-dependent dehydrogenase (short-subunit alcohol dehydrogenase family)
MALNPVALILGAGPRVGASVAERFLKSGYKVAVVSRSGNSSTQGVFSLKGDFTKPSSIPALFEAVKTEFHSAPSVVIYNAAALTPPPIADSLFSLPAEKFAADLDVNTVSTYVTAQETVKGWETLAKDTKKTFIYTGNGLNSSVVPVPVYLDLGVGKSASAHLIGLADGVYSAQGYR